MIKISFEFPNKGINIAGVIRSLLDTLSEAVAKGDMKTVRDTLQAIADQIRETLPKIASEKMREVIVKIFNDLSKLRRKFSDRKANLDDVRTFTNITRDTLKQRLADKILEKIKEHRQA